MKKLFGFLGIGMLMSSAVSCDNSKEKAQIEADQVQIAQLSADYNEAASFNDSLLLLMGDIYNGLDSINMQEGFLYNMGNGENNDRRAEVRNNLSAIKARLEANKKLLSDLEAKIKASGNENSILVKTISDLKQRLEQQDERIAVLEESLQIAKDSLDVLNTIVEETQALADAEATAKEEAIQAYTDAENQLNTVYYALGTKKELEKNGILEKKFLRATKVLQGDFNENYFTKADKRTLTQIPTNSKKDPKIMTNQPKGSYVISEEANGTKTIKITDPASFWSLTPYLVVEI